MVDRFRKLAWEPHYTKMYSDHAMLEIIALAAYMHVEAPARASLGLVRAP